MNVYKTSIMNPEGEKLMSQCFHQLFTTLAQETRTCKFFIAEQASVQEPDSWSTQHKVKLHDL